MLEIPSKVTKQKYIRMPNEEKVIDSDDEWKQCGKWILKDKTRTMAWVDETWIKLQPLLDKGYLLMIKASTAMRTDNPYDIGTILCFTRPGEEEIERAAKEIRKVVPYEGSLYYKKNYMTEYQIDHRYGHLDISSYMHTSRGFFYRRSPPHHWILVNGEENEKERKKSISMQKWNIANFEKQGSAQLLSRLSDGYITAQVKKGKLPTNTFLTITCSFEEDGNTLSEADRLWIIGKKFIDQGTIYKLSVVKKSSVAEFRFLILEKLDNESFIELCNRIQEEAQVFSFIYAKTGQVYYRYSPEKEFEILPDKFRRKCEETSIVARCG